MLDSLFEARSTGTANEKERQQGKSFGNDMCCMNCMLATGQPVERIEDSQTATEGKPTDSLITSFKRVNE